MVEMEATEPLESQGRMVRRERMVVMGQPEHREPGGRTGLRLGLKMTQKMLMKFMLNLPRRKSIIGLTRSIIVFASVKFIIGGKSMNTHETQQLMEEMDIVGEMVQMERMERMVVMEDLVVRVGEEETEVMVDLEEKSSSGG